MKRPELIIFNPDSYRGDVVGHLGDPAAHTPHLDALMDSGEAVSYRNTSCQNPVCVPSRCSFMTGQYPHVHGHRTMAHARHLDRDQSNLLHELKQAGYFIWWGGKNDLVNGEEDPAAHADIYFKAKTEDYARWGIEETPLKPESTWRGESDSDSYYSFLRGCLPDMDPDEIRIDVDYVTIRAAVEFLEDYRDDRPLCMFLALSCPHPQYAIEPRFYHAIDPEKIPPRIAPAELSGPVIRSFWTLPESVDFRQASYPRCRVLRRRTPRPRKPLLRTGNRRPRKFRKQILAQSTYPAGNARPRQSIDVPNQGLQIHPP